jgi:hypothetical protein
MKALETFRFFGCTNQPQVDASLHQGLAIPYSGLTRPKNWPLPMQEHPTAILNGRGRREYASMHKGLNIIVVGGRE